MTQGSGVPLSKVSTHTASFGFRPQLYTTDNSPRRYAWCDAKHLAHPLKGCHRARELRLLLGDDGFGDRRRSDPKVCRTPRADRTVPQQTRRVQEAAGTLNLVHQVT